jgi:hypothetical protein
VDKISNGKKDLWITEVNWPLEGTGKYSPASGKPNVSEDEQASYLVRYYALCLASGFVERVYWWQLVAPGYGLIDNRTGVWRKRPGFFAFQTMVGCLAGSRFLGRDAERRGMIFYFRKDGREIALCWTNGSPFEHVFARQVSGILSRDGEEISDPSRKILIEGKPKYVFFAS